MKILCSLVSHSRQAQIPHLGAVGEPTPFLPTQWSKTLAPKVVIKACYTLYELLFSFPAMFVTFGVYQDLLDPQILRSTAQWIMKGTCTMWLAAKIINLQQWP